MRFACLAKQLGMKAELYLVSAMRVIAAIHIDDTVRHLSRQKKPKV
ncbi:MAG: hypothetical protein JNN07_25120 [Verrucomicrobiales bacterium]|nr:hypothetical protein [Verrucomicrobiales bacterium]